MTNDAITSRERHKWFEASPVDTIHAIVRHGTPSRRSRWIDVSIVAIIAVVFVVFAFVANRSTDTPTSPGAVAASSRPAPGILKPAMKPKGWKNGKRH